LIDRLIPYSAEVYQGLFTYYYQTISPVHIVALGIGLFLFVLSARYSKRGGLIAQMVMAALWVWNGIVFHSQFLADLNWAAQYFGYAFIAQGALIAVYAFAQRDVIYKPNPGTRVASCVLIVLAMTFSPAVAAVLETPISQSQLFGVTPLTIILASVGTSLVMYQRPPLILWIIPILWSGWEVLTTQNLGLWSDCAFAGIALLSAAGVIIHSCISKH
jgi:hypothetical protein